jgi:hypothetical protein
MMTMTSNLAYDLTQDMPAEAAKPRAERPELQLVPTVDLRARSTRSARVRRLRGWQARQEFRLFRVV